MVSSCLLCAPFFQPGIRAASTVLQELTWPLKSEGTLEPSNLRLDIRADLKIIISEFIKGLGIGNYLKQEEILVEG